MENLDPQNWSECVGSTNISRKRHASQHRPAEGTRVRLMSQPEHSWPNPRSARKNCPGLTEGDQPTEGPSLSRLDAVHRVPERVCGGLVEAKLVLKDDCGLNLPEPSSTGNISLCRVLNGTRHLRMEPASQCLNVESCDSQQFGNGAMGRGANRVWPR